MSLLTSLYAYYAMEGNANDSTGTYNGTLSGTYNFGSTYGKILQGFNTTDAANGHFKVGTTSNFNFLQNTGEFSISFWMKTIKYTVRNNYPIGNTATSAQKGFYLGADSVTGTFRLAVFIGNGIPSTLINSAYTNFIQDNNWHHIVVTASKSNNRVYFYKDGVQYTPTSGTTVGTTTTGNSSNITQIGYTPAAELDGNIDEVGFWTRELSQSEVTELYNAGSGLTYPFLSASSNFFKMF